MGDVVFEVCLEHVDGIVEAIEGGAARVELCSSLTEGGLTPSHAAVKAAAALDIDTMVIIRPRGGDFYYSDRELSIMESDIAYCREMGVYGVVFGALTEEGDVAGPQVQRLLKAAGPLATTFHRAFDVCRNPEAALEQLIDYGFDRVLTSGQAATAPEGSELIRALHRQANGRIGILPGGGITPDNVRGLLRSTGVNEFHATAFERVASPMRHRNPQVYMGLPGLPEYELQRTSAGVIRNFLRRAKPSR